MSRHCSHQWLAGLGLLAILSGCASSHVSVLPGSVDFSKSNSESPHILAVGDEAIVSTVTGSEVKGKVVEVSASSVVLGHTGNYGYKQSRIDSKSIESIMWVGGGSVWPYLAVVGVGAVVWSADQLSEID